MKKIRFIFEKGGSLTGYLNEEWAPETVMAVWSALPTEDVLKHTRYCGHEVYCSLSTGVTPKRENHTATVSKFDISYWRQDWDPCLDLSPEEAGETIGFYSAPEYIRYSGGTNPLNVIGRIDFSQEAMLDEIEERIWRDGQEKVRIERADD